MPNKKKSNRSELLKFDLPFVAIVLLALLAVPRVVVHDLHILPLDSTLYKFLAVAPFAAWLAVAIFRKNRRPIHDFMYLGLVFGVLLAVTHQLTWDASWGENLPRLHGNLEGRLNPVVEGLLLRAAAFVSSLFTGALLGVGVAFVAWLSSKVRKSLNLG